MSRSLSGCVDRSPCMRHQARLQRTPMSTLSRKDLAEFSPIYGQLLLNIIEKCCCARHAFTYRRVGYEITRVVGEIALFAQSVEHDHPIHRQAEGERQRLNRGLVVPL